MFRDEVQSRLEDLAKQPDSWFRLRPIDPEGAFEATDATGATAAIDVREHWVEVSAARPVGGIVLGGGPSTLLRIAPGGDGHGGLRVAARLYLDGFSVQALFGAVRDVLALAGGGAPAERPPGMPAGVTLTDVTGPDAVELSDDDSHGASPAPPQEPEPAAPDSPSLESIASPDQAADPAESRAVPKEAAAVLVPNVDTPDAPQADPVPPAATAAEPMPANPTDAEERRVPSTIESARPGVARSSASPSARSTDATTGTCRRCGAVVQPGERFCMNCGAPQATSGVAATLAGASQQAAPSPPSPTPGMPSRPQVPETVVWRRPPAGLVPCPRCAAANPPESAFCENCGTPMTAGDAEAASPPPSTEACSRCGYANAADNRFCQGCGAALG